MVIVPDHDTVQHIQSTDYEKIPGVIEALDADSFPDLERVLENGRTDSRIRQILGVRKIRDWNWSKYTIPIMEFARLSSKISIWTHLANIHLSDSGSISYSTPRAAFPKYRGRVGNAPWSDLKSDFRSSFQSTLHLQFPNVSLTDVKTSIANDDYPRLESLLGLHYETILGIPTLWHVILRSIRHRSLSILHRLLTGHNQFNSEHRQCYIYAEMPISILVDIYQYGPVYEDITRNIVIKAMKAGLSILPYLQLRKSRIFPFVFKSVDFELAVIIRWNPGFIRHRDYILTILSDAETACKNQRIEVNAFLTQYPEYSQYYEGKEESEQP